MVTAIFAVGAFVATGILLLGVIRITKVCVDALNKVVDDLRVERELIGLQKQIVALYNKEIAIRQEMIEKQLKMAMNTVTAMRLMVEREKDPQWMSKFNEGRNNAGLN